MAMTSRFVDMPIPITRKSGQKVSGSSMNLNEKAKAERMANAIGSSARHGILSPKTPKKGAVKKFTKVEVKSAHWYRSFDLPSVMMPSSTKSVNQSTKKFEFSISISFNTATPRKHNAYFESLPHSSQTHLNVSLMLNLACCC